MLSAVCCVLTGSVTKALPTSTVAPLADTTTASPMGHNSCPYLPCPFVSPQWCVTSEATTYWRNVSGDAVLCEGCHRCVLTVQDVHRLEGRELNSQSDCEVILCLAVPRGCKVSATREPTQLVDHNGRPCPSCAVCLDYVEHPDTP